MTFPERLAAALSGRYRIERELGAGGMATVFLAADLKHDRKVAIKVLKPELAAVLGAERFVQEIKTTAALSHPHILPLFDSGEADGFLYYVMPYTEGETIREKLTRERQCGIDEAVKITTEVADALDYAHRHGVIHRDIKPENILLHDGRPMVMDFGIALAVSAAAGGRMTETGLSLGTPHYMSPEQATADRDITARSDIYSLASVLYEMLTGEPPHMGTSAQQIIMKIIAEPVPSAMKLRTSVPPNVDAALGKALEKLPADRFESAKAFADALADPAFSHSGSPRAVRARGPAFDARRWLAASAGSTVFFASIAIWALVGRPKAPDRGPVRFAIPVPTGIVLNFGEASEIAVSPDGRTVVYGTDGRLWRSSLESDSSEAIPGTEGATRPFISADGQWLGFSQNGELRRMPLAGGAAARVAAISYFFFGAAWLEDGTIVYARRGGLSRIPASGGAESVITTVGAGESEHAWPSLIPGRNAVLFTVLGSTGQWGDARLEALDLENGRRTVVRQQGSHGRYLPSGHVVFVDAGGTLSAAPFDVRTLTAGGEAYPVESGIRVGLWGTGAAFDVAGGTLAFARGSEKHADILRAANRDGTTRQLGEPVTTWALDVAPDGRRAALLNPAATTMEIWLMDIATGDRERLTFAKADEGMYEMPRWSSDGRRVAFSYAFGDSMRIATVPVDGSSPVQVLRTRRFHQHIDDWSTDGRWMVVNVAMPARGFDLQAIRLDSIVADVDLAVTRGNEDGARFSPDGRWVAYQSDESGAQEVYVVSFPDPRTRRQVSVDGGYGPFWSERSDELFFMKGTTLMATRVSTAGDFQRSTPVPAFPRTVAAWAGATVDGQRFVLASQNPAAPARELHIVVGWDAVVRAKGRR